MKKAFFVDRDGVLNEMVYDETHGLLDSPRRPGQVRLKKGAGAFLREVRRLGYLIIVVTNQPGIAKGTLTNDELNAVNARLSELLAADGGTWDALYYCPHHPTGDGLATVNEYISECSCRKPKPGLLLQAAREWNIDLADSWMLGDGIVDVQAGNAAGCRSILLAKLKPDLLEKFIELTARPPERVAATFDDALDFLKNIQRC